MADKNVTSYPKERIKILFLENISQSALHQFKKAGYTNIKVLPHALNEEELIKEIKQVHILGIRSKTRITKNVLQAATKLQVVGCFCIGVNQVDIKAAL
jgi:D-3-phosphoglycerate dehydrogenase